MPASLTTSAGPSWTDILAIAAGRQNDLSPVMAQMREIRDRYNGDIVYPWSAQISGGADMPDLTPHLVGEAIDNYGLRAASVNPTLFVPAINPGKERGPGSREYARVRRHALAGTLWKNRFPLLARRFFRHLAGYASAVIMVEPDFRTGRPRLRVVNPLNCFPDPQAAENYDEPTNCIFIHGHSAAALRQMYPALRSEMGGPIGPRETQNQLWDLLTYVDDELHVIGLAGKRQQWESDAQTYGTFRDAMELSRFHHGMETFPGVVMARVTLDRMGSAIGHSIGQLDWAARLQLLDVVATEKSIYPDTYIIADGARTPELVNGEWRDGRTGQVNLLKNVAAVGQLRATPDPAGKQSIDRMERNTRMTLGLAAQWGGETHNAVRTGRGINTLLDQSVDPRIHEMQEIAQAWMPHLFSAVLKCWEAYWPDESVTLHSGYPGATGPVTFTPAKQLAESSEVMASYPIAGADLQLTNIALSQMLGADAISLHTFRERHPWIDDANSEQQRVTEEKLELIALQSLTQQTMAGQIPMEQLAMIEEEYRKDPDADIFTAIRSAVERVRREQASTPAQVGPEGELAPGELMADPATMPGMGGPSGPMMAPPGPGDGELPSPIGPTSGMAGLRELQNALAAGGRRVTGVSGP